MKAEAPSPGRPTIHRTNVSSSKAQYCKHKETNHASSMLEISLFHSVKLAVFRKGSRSQGGNGCIEFRVRDPDHKKALVASICYSCNPVLQRKTVGRKARKA